MKKMNKKGFTIVELVIVIAVIAIMSAVLIPTFSGIIKKAKLSSDKKTIASMNEVLVETILETEEDWKYTAAIDALEASGFNVMSGEIWQPSSKGYSAALYINGDKVTMVLVNADNAVVYPEAYTDVAYDKLTRLTAGNYRVKSEAKTAEAAAQDITKAFENGNSIILKPLPVEANVVKLENVQVKNESTILDLGGNVLEAEYQLNSTTKHFYAVDVVAGASLTIDNGTISSRGVGNYGELTIAKNAKVEAVDNNGGACIWNYAGGIVTVEGGVFKTTSGNYIEDNDVQYEPGCVNNSGTMIINGGEFICENSGCYAINSTGNLTINNATVKAHRGAVSATAGTLIINGGTFEVVANPNWTDDKVAYALYYAGTANVTLNGGTFTRLGSTDRAIVADQFTGTFKDNR